MKQKNIIKVRKQNVRVKHSRNLRWIAYEKPIHFHLPVASDDERDGKWVKIDIGRNYCLRSLLIAIEEEISRWLSIHEKFFHVMEPNAIFIVRLSSCFVLNLTFVHPRNIRLLFKFFNSWKIRSEILSWTTCYGFFRCNMIKIRNESEANHFVQARMQKCIGKYFQSAPTQVNRSKEES